MIGAKSISYKLVGRINDGTDRYVSIIIGRTNQLTLKTARAKAQELKLALQRGEDPRNPKTKIPTLADALERYVESRSDLSAQTIKWYRQKLTGPLKPLLKLPVDRISRDQVRELHERISHQRGAYTANGSMRVLKLLLNDVARTHDLPPNPVTRAVRMNREKSRDWAVPISQLPQLWQQLYEIDDPVRRTCWLVLLFTGLRSHDARSMRWSDLDADGVLTVPNPKGGAAKAFKLPLPGFLLQRLEEVRQVTAPLESDFVFPSPGSKSGHLEQLRRTNQFPYSPHGMRHTWRTIAMEAGVDLSMAMVLLNHRPAGVTWNYVTRENLLGPMRDATEQVATFLLANRTA